ncbi:DNA/RNA-binding protein KIN17-like [Homarus americanus]|uniref:DNA/RNA-binding protein KIN17-like n=1 Tax=Homarus americanus TaxID=6706 RepID=A0A8J5JZ44_HOMAM|nr:DNA/RNA-binding protein KIN17-like [Homarus americanus]KAG7162054.1 DNA/RNA-binding protein KIN17-like [Homarus americanus]
MGKAEKGTPKDLANKMKAKGLQKLRWYCQMCEKQCRDENGFKCHTMSESHQRQLLLFAEDPDKYLDSFSQEFLDGYTSLLKRRFGTKRVQANNVYQEYIQDRHHIHMNATQWETLTDFVKWLGREGHCVVDETEKGWYVAYIDRDPETIRRQEQLKRREKFEKDEEERMQDFIKKQIELGRSKMNDGEAQYTELQRDEGETIALNIKLGMTKQAKPKLDVAGNILKAPSTSKIKTQEKIRKDAKRRTALDDIMEEEMKGKKLKEEMDVKNQIAEKVQTKEGSWLTKNIVVKVITKDLGSKYYKQKGVIREVIDKYIGLVKLLECGTKLKLDQAHLETVVPSKNRKVLIIGGRYRGQEAVLKSIQEETFSATLELQEGKTVDGVPYEHFSKLYTS